jgi:AraC-like DNA-binding protein
VELSLASNPAEFLGRPIGRCVVGRTFAIWCGAPDLTGTILWGVPDERDVREYVSLLEHARHPDMSADRRAIMDCRAIERVDTETLLTFTTLARGWMRLSSPRTKRHAVVVPDGISEILLAGAMIAVGPSHPFRVVRDLDEALAFLDHPAAGAAHEAAMALAAGVRGRSALLGRLRLQLAVQLADATVERAASGLRLSTRTLQRELRAQGTTFSDELRRARVAAAAELLRLSDLKIEVIANRVGFCSASRASAAIRRELGVTASELRGRAADLHPT